MALPTLAQFPLEAQADEFGGYEYRALRRDPAKPMQKGWDVYGVQTALIGIGYELPKFGADGYAGDEFSVAIWRFQQSRPDLVDDGIAGIATQRALVLVLADRLARQHVLPANLLQGQIEQESGFQVGNFTPVYPATGKRDLGAVQQNLTVTTESCRQAFDTRAAVAKLAGDAERGLRVRKDRYRQQVGAVSDQRAWELASGSWNAPSWADTLAAGKPLRAEYRAKIEDYIDRVTKYVTNWTP